MNAKDYLSKVAYVGNFQGDPVYKSKFDDSYITHVGMEDEVQYLADREITEELTHGVGFSPKDQKWYGWSHRAIYGFKIGSTCKKGDCHYNGNSEEAQRVAAIEFWRSSYHQDIKCKGIIERNGERFFDIEWVWCDSTPNEKLRGTISGCQHYIKPLGRGEWVAETMEDAKQMAIDFNEGVS